jgi:hypothetical protein
MTPQRRAIGPSVILLTVIVIALGMGAAVLVSNKPVQGGSGSLSTTLTTISTSTTTTVTGQLSFSSASRPVEVVVVVGPIPPYNPGGPVIDVTLRNAGDAPIASLNATLRLSPPSGLTGQPLPSTFIFSVGASDPLLPGQNIQDNLTVIGGSLQTGQDYPLTINGTTLDGQSFSYTVFVQIVPPPS